VVGGADDLPNTTSFSTSAQEEHSTLQSISIVASPLKELFPPTSESGPVPAAAIVLVEQSTESQQPPVYLQVHSEDTGECPSGQCKSHVFFYHPVHGWTTLRILIYIAWGFGLCWELNLWQTELDNPTDICSTSTTFDIFANVRVSGIIYGSTLAGPDVSSQLLHDSIAALLQSVAPNDSPSTSQILWHLAYKSHAPQHDTALMASNRRIRFPTRRYDVAVEDDILEPVRKVWEQLLPEESGEAFLRFEERGQDADEGWAIQLIVAWSILGHDQVLWAMLCVPVLTWRGVVCDLLRRLLWWPIQGNITSHTLSMLRWQLSFGEVVAHDQIPARYGGSKEYYFHHSDDYSLLWQWSWSGKPTGAAYAHAAASLTGQFGVVEQDGAKAGASDAAAGDWMSST
jgi:hypothetical protein